MNYNKSYLIFNTSISLIHENNFRGISKVVNFRLALHSPLQRPGVQGLVSLLFSEHISLRHDLFRASISTLFDDS